MGRQSTKVRRAEILAAALDCFSTLGYEQATIADIRARARVSTGSLYHHFGSKEQIAGALYLQCLAEAQAAGLDPLLRARTARGGVRALVHAYLDWVAAHRDQARFLLGLRHAPFMDDSEAALAAMNDDTRRESTSWFQRHVDSGELADLDPTLRRAIIFGPARQWAGRWLADETAVPLAVAKRALADAAYAGLVAHPRP